MLPMMMHGQFAVVVPFLFVMAQAPTPLVNAAEIEDRVRKALEEEMEKLR